MFSLVIAICLWFVVLNVENPVETKTFTSNIEIMNESALIEQNKTVLNIEEIRNTRVTVRVRGNRLTLDRLTQGKDVKAYIDLATIGATYSGQEISVPVKVNVPSTIGDSITIEFINPQQIVLKTDNLISKDMEVTVGKDGYEMDGFETGSMIADPAIITVYGPQGEVDKVNAVSAFVDVSMVGGDKVVEAVPVAYDADGNEVKGVFLSDNSVNVSIDMKRFKIVGINASISGVAADGYVIGKVTPLPETLFVVGEEDVLNGVESIVIDSVNVFGRKETFTTDIYIGNYLPSGVSLRRGSSEKVQLTVEIEQQVEAEVEFAAETVEVTGYDAQHFDVVVEPADLKMVVCGNGETMSAFDASTLTYNVDLSGLAAGKHTVGISCKLPENVMIYGERPTINVELIEKITEETEVTE